MNGPMHDDREWTQEQRRAREAVASLSAPQASDAFRDRLRAGFVSGALAEPSPTEAAGRRFERASSPAPPRPAIRRSRWQWVASVAVAAGLVLLVSLMNQGAGWSVTGHEGLDYVVLDGKMVLCSDLSPVEAALHPGCRIDVPEGGMLALASVGAIAMEFEAGTSVTLPRAPGRWFGRDIESTLLNDGAVCVATADANGDGVVRVVSGDLAIAFRGGAVRVTRDGEQIEVAVLDGEAAIEAAGGTTRRLAPGQRSRIDATGAIVAAEPLATDELSRLAALRSRAAAL